MSNNPTKAEYEAIATEYERLSNVPAEHSRPEDIRWVKVIAHACRFLAGQAEAPVVVKAFEDGLRTAQAIKARMEELGLSPKDMAPYIGSKSRVSEILNGKRQPTVKQIRALHHNLGIPLATLVGLAAEQGETHPIGDWRNASTWDYSEQAEPPLTAIQQSIKDGTFSVRSATLEEVEVVKLKAEVKQLRDALTDIKIFVVGSQKPDWKTYKGVTEARIEIVNICDIALSKPKGE